MDIVEKAAEEDNCIISVGGLVCKIKNEKIIVELSYAQIKEAVINFIVEKLSEKEELVESIVTGSISELKVNDVNHTIDLFVNNNLGSKFMDENVKHLVYRNQNNYKIIYDPDWENISGNFQIDAKTDFQLPTFSLE